MAKTKTGTSTRGARATTRLTVHEQTAWMLRSLLEE